ncbi:MAG: protease complex subunit PrcB family protein [Pyrinomonadaceae bacterium]
MKFLYLLMIIVLFGIIGAGDAQAQKKIKKIRKKTMIKKVETPEKVTAKDEFKVLLQDDQSGMEEPFVFVARNSEQYAELQNVAQNIPADSIDFTQNAVIAVFAGQKPTAGFGINFEKTTASITDQITISIKVNLISPPKGAMLAQVLTAPAKIVLIPLAEDNGLSLILDSNWRRKMQTFRVSQSTFEASGGLTGKSRKFKLAGSIDILQAGNLVTAFFNIGTGAKQIQGIFDTATGRIENDSIVLPRIDAGNLIENPHPPLKAIGKFSEKEFSLTFESLPTNVADGFSGQGNLIAVKTK